MMNKKVYFYFFIIIVTLFHFDVKSQSLEFFYGRLIDSESNQSVPFATILLKNQRKGVISNNQGDFSIPLTAQNLKDTLIISCIGYTSKRVVLKQLKTGELNTIILKVSTTKLDEISITAKKEKPLTAKKIVKKSIQNIPGNYPHEPFSYVAYYRDYQIKENDYVNLNEAILEVYDSGFHTFDRGKSQISLLEYKVNKDFERDQILEINYDNSNQKFIPDARIDPSGGNELTLLMIHDAIRNYEVQTYSYMYIMKESLLKNHSFKINKTLIMDDKTLYVIDFKSENFVDQMNYKANGQLFIDALNFAIHKLSYALYKLEGNEKSQLFSVQVEYAKRQDHMYLNYISFNNTFKTPNANDFLYEEVIFNKTTNELIIEFNNPYDPTTIKDLSNYKILLNKKRIKVKNVIAAPFSNSKIHLKLDIKEANLLAITSKNAKSLQYIIKNVKDINGRVLGKRTFSEHQQFREMFVQQVHSFGVNKPLKVTNKFLPLKYNEVIKSENIKQYWMNSPLKKKGKDMN